MASPWNAPKKMVEEPTDAASDQRPHTHTDTHNTCLPTHTHPPRVHTHTHSQADTYTPVGARGHRISRMPVRSPPPRLSPAGPLRATTPTSVHLATSSVASAGISATASDVNSAQPLFTSREIAHVCVCALRRFAVGVGLNSGLALLQLLLRFGPRRLCMNLHMLRSVVLNKESLGLGSMMAAYGLLYTIVRTRMRMSGTSRIAQAAVAGAVAGTSIYALTPCVGTHLDPTELALHTLVRAVQACVSQTTFGALLHHVDAAIFIASCTIIMYSWFFHPQTLTPSYRRWISRMADMDQRLLLALRALKDGKIAYGKHTDFLDDYCRSHGLPREEGDVGNGFLSCKVVHPQDGALCIGNSARRFARGFRASLALYVPVHFIAQGLVQRRELLQRPDFKQPMQVIRWLGAVSQYIKRATVSSLRSSAFLGSFIALAWSGVCLMRNTIKDDAPAGPLLGSFLSGWSIFIEHPKRRAELAAYVAPRALHCAWQRLEENGIVRSLPGAHVTVFSLACALLMIAYERSREMDGDISPRAVSEPSEASLTEEDRPISPVMLEDTGEPAAPIKHAAPLEEPQPLSLSTGPSSPGPVSAPVPPESVHVDESVPAPRAIAPLPSTPPSPALTASGVLRRMASFRHRHFPPTLGAIVELFTQ